MATHAKDLATTLQEALNKLEQLATILQAENLAITQRDATQLNGLTQEKYTLLNELEEVYELIVNHLQAAHLPVDDTGINTYIKQQAQPEVTTELWQQFLAASKVCQAQNLSNGRLLQINHQAIGQLATLLFGKSAESEVSLYDQRGQKSG